MENFSFQEVAGPSTLPAHEKSNTGRAKQAQEEEGIYSDPARFARGFREVNRGQTLKP